MKIRCKIQPRYLKEILEGEKNIEFRQFDSIELEEIGTGRKVVFKIGDIQKVPLQTAHSITDLYKNVPWRPLIEYPLYRIPLLEKIEESPGDGN